MENDNRGKERFNMLEFILAGILYLVLMFLVLFCFTFFIIGITYAITAFFKRFALRVRPAHLALK